MDWKARLPNTKRLDERSAEVAVLIAVIIYVLSFSYLTISKYSAFETSHDLAVFSQTLWTTLHGLPFHSSLDPEVNPLGSYFGIHFSPLLGLIVPLYALFPDPRTLLVLQSFVTGLGALPLFWIARYELKSDRLALLFATLYLLNPALNNANLADFHLETFIPTIFLFAFYSFLTRRWASYFVSVGLAMITMEHVELLVAAFGLYWLIVQRKALARFATRVIKQGGWRRGIGKENVPVAVSIITLFLGATMFGVALSVISLNRAGQPLVLTSWYGLGTSLSQVVGSILNPAKLVGVVFQNMETKAFFLLDFLAMFGFLPLLSPLALLMAVPWFGISMLSSVPVYYSIGAQYPANLVPFFGIASVYGFKRLRTVSSRPRLRFASIHTGLGKLRSSRMALAVPVLVIVVASVSFSPLNSLNSGAQVVSGCSQDIGRHQQALNQFISLIPANASVLTQEQIASHVADRFKVYPRFVGEPPDYIMVDMNPPASILKAYQWRIPVPILDSLSPTGKPLNLSDYGPVASADGVILLQDGYKGEPKISETGPLYNFSFESLTYPGGEKTIAPGSISSYVLVHTAMDSPGVFWYGPYAMFPPGNYTASFRLKTSSNQVGYLLTLDIVSNGGHNVLAARQISGGNFTQAGQWQDFVVGFHAANTTMLELRGMSVSDAADVYLDCISVDLSS